MPRGALGVATVTQGPGLTNTATALTEAVRSGTPLLVITGDTAPGNKLNQQTLDRSRSSGRRGPATSSWSGRRTPPRPFGLAARRALEESRPYVLNCPTEYQWQVVDAGADDEGADPWPVSKERPLPAEDVVEEALGVIAAARRPASSSRARA